MIKRHLDGVLRYVKHPITNGVAEGLNSKIMSIKRKAGGFRNPSHFTTAIYFPLRRARSLPTLIPERGIIYRRRAVEYR